MTVLSQDANEKTVLTTVKGGEVVAEKTNEDIRKEELASAEKLGDKVKAEKLTKDTAGEKDKFREFLYKTQDMYTQRITQKQIDLMNARTEDERQMILREVAEMGAFCRALENEIRFLRSH